jgi:hypothetical protein
VTDGDGDTTTATVSITLAADSEPTVTARNAEVDETGDLDSDTQSLTVDFGNDAGTLSLSAVGATWDATAKTLRADNGDWKVVVNDDNTYTVTQLQVMTHIDDTDPNDPVTVTVTATAAETTGTDQDTTNFTVTFLDDGPTIANTQDAILTNEIGNILTGADLGINIGADSPIASIVLTPEVDDDGFAIDSSGGLLTSTVGEITYNLVYVQNDDGSVTAWQDTVDGSAVFTLTPNITTGTYSVEILGQLDGASQNFEVNFASAEHNTSGNGEILTYNSDGLYVVATADGDPHDKVNYNSQIGIGASNQFIDKAGEYLTLQFTNSTVVTTSIADAKADAEGDPAYFSGAIFEIGKFDSGDTITWTAYHGSEIVGTGTGYSSTVHVSVTDPGDTFNSVVFEGTDGSAYAILSMEVWTAGEDDPGVIHTINVDIAATDADGDVVYAYDALQVTFDNDGNIAGTDSDEMIVGGDGDDYIDGGLGADTVYGRAGNDTIEYDAFDTEIDGGDGFDTLVGNADIINLANVSNIDVIQLSAGATVTSNGINGIVASDVIGATDDGTLIIQSADSSLLNQVNIDTDSLVLQSESVNIDGIDYAQYIGTFGDDTATLLIELNDNIVVD